MWRIDPEPIEDERGLFARTFCADEFEARGLPSTLRQCNTSWNRLAGTVRGMHYQARPAPEAKLVRVTRGAVYDVVVDLRASSPTFLEWEGFELDARERAMLFIAPGFAHGFMTLEDDTELLYQMSEFYDPALARGLRWDDPLVRVEWPAALRAISERDTSYPDFDPDAAPFP